MSQTEMYKNIPPARAYIHSLASTFSPNIIPTITPMKMKHELIKLQSNANLNVIPAANKMAKSPNL